LTIGSAQKKNLAVMVYIIQIILIMGASEYDFEDLLLYNKQHRKFNNSTHRLRSSLLHCTRQHRSTTEDVQPSHSLAARSMICMTVHRACLRAFQGWGWKV
jgi:hypothetical protein